MVKSVYLLFGREHYLKEKALNEYKAKLLPQDTASFNYSLFYGDAAAAKEIVDCAATVPFLGSRRLVVVRRFEKLRSSGRAALRAYARHPSPSTCLLLETNDEKVLREFKPCAQHVGFLYVDEAKKVSTANFLKERASVWGKTIDDDAVVLLKELVGDAFDCLAGEIEKVMVFAGSRKRITVNDVEVMVEKELVGSTFSLVDAIGAKNAPRALSLTAELMAAGKRYHEITGVLSWHLRRLLKAKELLRSGRRREQVVAALKIGRRFQGAFLSQLSKVTLSEVEKKLEMLLRADVDMKTGRIDPKVSLELAVIRLCF